MLSLLQLYIYIISYYYYNPFDSYDLPASPRCHYTQPWLLPPPILHHFSWASLHLQEEVHDRTGGDVLCHRILTPTNIELHIL